MVKDLPTNYQKGILIPLYQSGILGISGCLLGYAISGFYLYYRWYIIFTCGFILYIAWLWNAFDRSYGIKSFSKKKVYTTSIPQPINMTTKITLISDNGRRGDCFTIPDFPLSILEKVAFYLEYCGARLSYQSLDVELNIFTRKELEKFKLVLLNGKLVEYKDIKNKRRGIQLTNHGRKIFRELAKRYTPPPLERNTLIKYFKNYDIRNRQNM